MGSMMPLADALVSLKMWLSVEAMDARLGPLGSVSLGVVGEMGLTGDCTVSALPALLC
jgi:hypothetical protein